MLQGNKIKELEQIAIQQVKQTQILSEMLNQTIFEHFQRTAPKFEVVLVQPIGLKQVNIQLKLLNSHAIITSFSIFPPGFVSVNSIQLGKTINPGKMIDLSLRVTDSKAPTKFDLFINYTDDERKTFVQRGVVQIGSNKTISLNLLSIRPINQENT